MTPSQQIQNHFLGITNQDIKDHKKMVRKAKVSRYCEIKYQALKNVRILRGME